MKVIEINCEWNTPMEGSNDRPSPDKGPLKALKNGRRSAYKIKFLPLSKKMTLASNTDLR